MSPTGKQFRRESWTGAANPERVRDRASGMPLAQCPRMGKWTVEFAVGCCCWALGFAGCAQPSMEAAPSEREPPVMDVSAIDAGPAPGVDEDSGATVAPSCEDTRTCLPPTDDEEPTIPAPAPAQTPAALSELFDESLNSARDGHAAWAHLIEVVHDGNAVSFRETSFGDTADRVDYFPASTVKIFATTAAMELMNEYDLSLDANATFYHWDGAAWIEDASRPMRDIIEGAVRCSSNEDHTLLLRFAGLDYLHREFFIPENGFEHTRLMRGYHHQRPYQYVVEEPQLIVLEEAGTMIERMHEYSGDPYVSEMCQDARICTTVREQAEHMRRLMFHEELSANERFSLREADLDWFRYGDSEPVLNDKARCGGSTRAALADVLPDAQLWHKGGFVTGWYSSVDYVFDEESSTEYIAAIATQSSSVEALVDLTRAVVQFAHGHGATVTLENLRDQVNPVVATVHVSAPESAILELLVRPKGTGREYMPLAGARLQVPAGSGAYTLRSQCLTNSITYDVLARMTTPSGTAIWSEPHFVIVDATLPCTQ